MPVKTTRTRTKGSRPAPLSSAALKGALKSEAKQVMLHGPDGEELGFVEVKPISIKQFKELGKKLKSVSKKNDDVDASMELLFDGIRACVPLASKLDDEDLFTLVNRTGGMQGELSSSVMRLAYGVDYDKAVNPTRP